MAYKLYAVINQDGLVVNTAVWDEVETWDIGPNLTKRDVTGLGVGKGWTWTGDDNYTPPEVVEPPPEERSYSQGEIEQFLNDIKDGKKSVDEVLSEIAVANDLTDPPLDP